MTHTSTTSTSSPSHLSRPTSLKNVAAIQYYTNDHVRTRKIEDRLKQWHTQMGDNPKIQIRSLTRYVSYIKSSI